MWIRNGKNWLWLFAAGSLWGLVEVAGGEAFYRDNIPLASVWLTAWALFVLAASRGVLNRAGTSTVIAGFAALFKLVNAAPFFCHLLGIFILGLAFDAASTLLLRKDFKTGRLALAGGLSAFSSNGLFGAFMTYIVRYKYWTEPGGSKLINHVFMSGTATALAACLLVPLGWKLGARGEAFSLRRPKLAFAGTGGLLLVVWTLGRLLS